MKYQCPNCGEPKRKFYEMVYWKHFCYCYWMELNMNHRHSDTEKPERIPFMMFYKRVGNDFQHINSVHTKSAHAFIALMLEKGEVYMGDDLMIRYDTGVGADFVTIKPRPDFDLVPY